LPPACLIADDGFILAQNYGGQGAHVAAKCIKAGTSPAMMNKCVE
jgi:hypothetical protein